MVFSELLIKIPYKIISLFNNKILNKKEVCFYADSALDYVIFKNIHKHIPGIKIVSKNRKVQSELMEQGVSSDLYPVFPYVLLMARHSLHKFPDNSIIKIGMRHGAYHFKEFINPEKYNAFDLFLLTSQSEVMQARETGINSAVSGGFPKIDDLFDEKYIIKAEHFKKKTFNNNKPVLLFTATWENSGLSAVDKWYDKLDLLTEKYNLMITLHPWVSDKKQEIIKNTKNVYFIKDRNTAHYLLAADIMIADTSSIIAEFNSLDKPVITFRISKKGRLPQEIIDMLEEMTYRIDNFFELEKMIRIALEKPDELSSARVKYNKIMFHQPFGNHGGFAAEIISDFLKEKGISI